MQYLFLIDKYFIQITYMVTCANEILIKISSVYVSITCSIFYPITTLFVAAITVKHKYFAHALIFAQCLKINLHKLIYQLILQGRRSARSDGPVN